MIVILMGVSGSGKTTIGTLLAEKTHAVFADGDTYHSPENRAKMAGGHALNDNDRLPWLQTLNGLMLGWFEDHKDAVLACSALKESYRKILVRGLPDESNVFVMLDGSRELIAERLAKRHGHYMNPQLLDSQIATLETPEKALRVVNDGTPEVVVDEILRRLTVQLKEDHGI